MKGLTLFYHKNKKLMKKAVTIAFCLLIVVNDATFSQSYSKAIEDNSFFIEEAYNQEYRVVQHISGFLYGMGVSKTLYNFTQEWPLGGQTNQLSLSIPIVSESFSTGVGDMVVNYRYQLFTKEDWAAASPRISLILPTGNKDKGFGNGKAGIEVNLPFSKRVSEKFVVHFNFGATLFQGVRFNLPHQSVLKDLYTYNTGGSVIYLASYNLNFMLEYLFTYFNEIDDLGTSVYATRNILSPGIRYAIDFGDVQVVPGIAIPIFMENNKTKANFFFYLSIEHPY